MTLNRAFKFFTFFSILSFAFSIPNHVVFFPSPGNFDSVSAFAKISKILTNTGKYGCMALLHDVDRDIFTHTNCTKVIYGAKNHQTYLQSLYKAHNEFERNPVLSLRYFKKVYQQQINDLFETNLIEKLKDVKIDALVCDAENLLCDILANKDQRIKTLYYSNTMINPYWLDAFDIPLGSYPMPNSPYNTSMTFFERVNNHINYYTLLFVKKYKQRLVNQILAAKGKEINSPFHYNSKGLFVSQNLPHLDYPLYLPPNIVSLGCVSCMFPGALPLPMKNFIGKRQRNIFVKLDRMKGYNDSQIILEALGTFKDIGFIVQGNLAVDVEAPLNVFRTDPVNVCDALYQKKIVAFINDGDYASLIQGIYHKKPMVVLGYNSERKANAVLIKEKELGTTIIDEGNLTKDNLIKEIKEVLTHKMKYIENMTPYSRRMMDDRTIKKEVKLLFDLYIENGSNGLVFEPYYRLTWLEYNNWDIWLMFGLILLGVWYYFRRLGRGSMCSKIEDIKVEEVVPVSLINSLHLENTLDDNN